MEGLDRVLDTKGAEVSEMEDPHRAEGPMRTPPPHSPPMPRKLTLHQPPGSPYFCSNPYTVTAPVALSTWWHDVHVPL